MSDVKRTSLYQTHVDLGAKMIPFAGYDMPVRYTSLMEEHNAVRNSVGVFDVSHMGEFLISGSQALDLIQRISSNNASKLEIGQAQYSCMPNNSDGIVDDLITYRLGDQEYMLVVNASNIQKDWEWISAANTYGAVMQDVSEAYALLAVQGPKASELLHPLTDVILNDIEYYHFVKGSIAGIEGVIISATGYTGSGGFELYIPAEKAPEVWKAIFSVNNGVEVLPTGLGARDTLRLEMGYCLYGNDIDDSTSPIEAGLGWITKFDHDFINAKSLEDQKVSRPSKRLVGFEMDEKGIPRGGYDILSIEGEKIGMVTSGTMSPTLNKGIGLGYVSVPHHKKGTEILIQIRKKQLPATIKRPPFVVV